MIISHEYKFIFIKTRKTAGSSLETQIRNHLGEHDIFAPYGVGDYYGERFDPLPCMIECLSNPKLFTRTAKGRYKDFFHVGKIVKNWMDWYNKARYYPHIPAIFVRNRVPESVWSNYFKFCVERNPWDKVISDYFHYRFNHRKHYGKNPSFQYFMDNELYKRVSFNYPLYTDIEQENIIVDRVLYYENLTSELREVLNWLGIPFNSLDKNIHGSFRTDRRPYQEFFSGENEHYVDVVRKEFKKEIDLHGYEF